jgi:hypothetical protein
MKKILLLEDKIDRDSLKQSNVDFDNFSFLETKFGDKANDQLNKFIANNDDFNSYDTIIIHGSIQCIEENIVSLLRTYCSKNNKSLVIFSGGSDISSFQNNILEITAKSFYENIEVFLNHYSNTSHVLMLAYGEIWALNILLNLLEKLNIFVENNEDNHVEDFDDFEDDFDLLKIKKLLNNIEYENLFRNIDKEIEEISISQIKIMSDNLKKLIEAKANE